MSVGGNVPVLPFLSHDDGMIARVRAFNWSSTALGDVATWSPELIAAISFVLESRFPAALLWGEETVLIPNNPFAEILGSTGADQLGRRFDEVWWDRWDEIGPMVERGLEGAPSFVEGWSTTLDRQGWTERAWFTVSTSPLRGADGTVCGVILTLIETTSAAQANTRAEMLAGELGHRLKNTMAMVHAMAQQSLRDIPDRAAVEAFKDRIVALGRAHDVLLQDNWEHASIASVVTTLTALHDGAGQFHATGPDLTLGPRAVLSLSMLLHELATNASKYGALSSEQGSVSIAWSIEDAGGGTLVVDWRERGGPPARASGRQGFGSRLINLGLLGTRQVDMDFGPEGFEATFRAPLRQLQRS